MRGEVFGGGGRGGSWRVCVRFCSVAKGCLFACTQMKNFLASAGKLGSSVMYRVPISVSPKYSKITYRKAIIPPGKTSIIVRWCGGRDLVMVELEPGSSGIHTISTWPCTATHRQNAGYVHDYETLVSKDLVHRRIHETQVHRYFPDVNNLVQIALKIWGGESHFGSVSFRSWFAIVQAIWKHNKLASCRLVFQYGGLYNLAYWITSLLLTLDRTSNDQIMIPLQNYLSGSQVASKEKSVTLVMLPVQSK